MPPRPDDSDCNETALYIALETCGKTLAQCSESGLFSLVLEGTRVTVVLPHFCVWLLCDVVQLCPGSVVNPFGYDWQVYEKIALWALLYRVQAKLLLGRYTVPLSELCPGALGHEATLSKQVSLQSAAKWLDGWVPVKMLLMGSLVSQPRPVLSLRFSLNLPGC